MHVLVVSCQQQRSWRLWRARRLWRCRRFHDARRALRMAEIRIHHQYCVLTQSMSIYIEIFDWCRDTIFNLWYQYRRFDWLPQIGSGIIHTHVYHWSHVYFSHNCNTVASLMTIFILQLLIPISLHDFTARRILNFLHRRGINVHSVMRTNLLFQEEEYI